MAAEQALRAKELLQYQHGFAYLQILTEWQSKSASTPVVMPQCCNRHATLPARLAWLHFETLCQAHSAVQQERSEGGVLPFGMVACAASPDRLILPLPQLLLRAVVEESHV